MTHIDSDVFVAWERGDFDLLSWLSNQGEVAFSATAWQELSFGIWAWEKTRAHKRSRHLEILAAVPVVPFEKRHASRAAQIDAELKMNKIGFADCQIAATAIEESAD